MPKNAIIPGGRLIEVEAAAALARLRNFRAAAADVGLSPTAFSRTIASLEDRLGVQLFARTTRSVSPTSAGERFLARAQPALHDLRNAMADAQEERDQPTGLLRLNCSIGAARRLLEPVLLAFLARYPDMRIEVVTNERLIDIVAQEFDAGFRVGRAVPGDMASVPIGTPLRHAVVASPGIIREHGVPQSPNDLLDRPCVRVRRADGAIYLWKFSQADQRFSLDVPGSFMVDDSTLAHQAALAGAGFAYVARWNVEKDLTAGRLTSVLEPWLPEETGLCLYYPRARHPSAGLRALIAFIEAQPPFFGKDEAPSAR